MTLFCPKCGVELTFGHENTKLKPGDMLEGMIKDFEKLL